VKPLDRTLILHTHAGQSHTRAHQRENPHRSAGKLSVPVCCALPVVMVKEKGISEPLKDSCFPAVGMHLSANLLLERPVERQVFF